MKVGSKRPKPPYPTASGWGETPCGAGPCARSPCAVLGPRRHEVRRKNKNEPTPFAVGLDGHVYMSVMELDGVASFEDALTKLKPEKRYFIGVVLTEAEERRLRPYMFTAGREAAGFIAGGRRWK